MSEWDKLWKTGDARYAMWTSKDADWIRKVKAEGDRLQQVNQILQISKSALAKKHLSDTLNKMSGFVKLWSEAGKPITKEWYTKFMSYKCPNMETPNACEGVCPIGEEDCTKLIDPFS